MTLITPEALKQALAEMKTNSAMALHILDVCQRPDSDATELANAVEPDPSISLRVLRLANSPMYAARSEITSIQDAVARIGRDNTQSIAVTAALGADDGEACPPRYWERALTTAAAADLYGRLSGRRLSDAFSTGLLLDVGCYLMYRLAPGEYSISLEDSDEQHTVLVQIEDERFHLTHSQVGALALAELGLPAPLCEAISSHHHALDSSATPILVAAAAAAALADAYMGDVDMEDDGWVAQSLGITWTDLHAKLTDSVRALEQSAMGV